MVVNLRDVKHSASSWTNNAKNTQCQSGEVEIKTPIIHLKGGGYKEKDTMDVHI